MNVAFADWQIGGIWTLQSGSPFTVNLSTDNANNGAADAPSQRPNQICDPNSGPKTTAEWFNTSCFVTPAPLALRQRRTRYRGRVPEPTILMRRCKRIFH